MREIGASQLVRPESARTRAVPCPRGVTPTPTPRARSPSSRSCSWSWPNLAVLRHTRGEVRGTASEKLPGPIVAGCARKPGDDIIPQARSASTCSTRYTGQIIDRPAPDPQGPDRQPEHRRVRVPAARRSRHHAVPARAAHRDVRGVAVTEDLRAGQSGPAPHHAIPGPSRSVSRGAARSRPRRAAARRAARPSSASTPGSRRPRRSSSSSTRCPSTLPPRATSSAAASSRVCRSSEPVSTKVIPASESSTSSSAGPGSPGEVDARGAQLLDEPAVAIEREPLPTLSAMIGPTPSNAASSSDRRRLDRVEVGEAARERLRGGRSDVVDAEPHEHAPQRPRLRSFDRVDEQLRGALADPFERDEPLERERVDVGGVLEQAGIARTGDTRSSPRPSMSIAPRPAKCTIRCTRCAGQSTLTQWWFASPSSRTSGCAAHRARGRELPLARPALAASRAPARRPRGSRRPPCARSRCPPAARLCARPRLRCAASPSRRWRRRRTPARAPRTASRARCGRCSP